MSKKYRMRRRRKWSRNTYKKNLPKRVRYKMRSRKLTDAASIEAADAAIADTLRQQSSLGFRIWYT